MRNLKTHRLLPKNNCPSVQPNVLERSKSISQLFIDKRTPKNENSSKKKIKPLFPITSRAIQSEINLKTIYELEDEKKIEMKNSVDEYYDQKEESKSLSDENKCSVCNKIFTDDLLKIPTCSHKFCKLCFEKDFKGTCQKCLSFFKSKYDKSSKKVKLCILCTKTASNILINCYYHAYCKDCYNFLLINEFSHIKKLSSCNSCLDHFKTNKSEVNKVGKVNFKIIQNKEAVIHPVNNLKRSEKKNLSIKSESTEDILKNILKPEISKKLKNEKIIDHSFNSTCKEKIDIGISENSKNNEIESESNENQTNRELVKLSSNNELEKCHSKNCDIKSNKLNSVPKCSEHRYCETCFINEQPVFDCDSCYNYFTCINSKSVFNFLNCSLCGQETEYSLFNCDSHRYCELCYQFFIKNNFSHINFVIHCKVCNSFFNNAKSLEERKELENKVKRSRSKKKLTTNGEISVCENEVEYKKCSNEICSIKSEKIFKTTTCSEHQYCINCIKNENIQCSCTNCKKYFKQQKSNFYLSNNWCHVCLDFVPNTKYKCSLHTYCKNCYKYLKKEDLNKIDSVSNCNECKLFFEKIKSQASNKIINHADSKPKLPCCACNCEIQSEKPYTTSKCNSHNYCKNCIQSGRTSSSCENCSNYFECLYLSVFNLKDFCFVCKDTNLNNSNYCKLHNYCVRCYDFLKNNDIDQIEMVSKCNKCSLDFKVLKL